MIKNYFSQLKEEFRGYNAGALMRDLLAGLTVAAVALPLALAFGVSSGADAAAGLITAIIAGFVISALSGASFQISGPTGAMTAVLVTIVAKYTMQGVFIVTLMAGIIVLAAGILRLGKLVSLIPRPVITGFTSGIAIIIFLGQIDNFFGTVSEGETAIEKLISYGRLGFKPDWQTVLLGGIVIVTMLVFPKKWNAKVPSSLVGIVVSAVVCAVFRFDVATVGEIPRTLFPELRLNLSGIKLEMLKNLLSPAVSVAMLAMIESLLCGASASRLKDEKFDANQELIAQGVGNILIPFFGGVPATAAIARTSVAIKSGAVTRLTGIFHAAGLLVIMFVLSPVMSGLPLSALAGVLIVTAWRMNEWESIRRIFGKKQYSAILGFAVTMLATVIFDLTVAIIIGIVFSILMFIVSATDLNLSVSKVENAKFNGDGDIECNHVNAYIIYITGAVFFANADKIKTALAGIADKNEIIFSFRGVSSIDATGIETVSDICTECHNSGVKLRFCGISKKLRRTLDSADLTAKIGKENIFPTIDNALLNI